MNHRRGGATAIALAMTALLLRAAAPAASAQPASADRGPTVAIDEAHGNAGATSGRLAAFADLLTRDGYRVVPSSRSFDAGPLAAIDVLVVAAGDGPPSNEDRRSPGRIAERECDVVRDWVRAGGSLLVAAGGLSPAGSLDQLVGRFGVDAGGGRVFDRVSGGGLTTALEFSRANGRLGDHPILRGAGRTAPIARIRTAAGQSIGVPRGAAILLKLGETAREAMTRNDLEAEEFAARQEADIAGSFSVPAAGRAEAIALAFGKGRLVALGDPYLLSAAGLTASDADNRSFALNVVRWLLRRLT